MRGCWWLPGGSTMGQWAITLDNMQDKRGSQILPVTLARWDFQGSAMTPSSKWVMEGVT